MKDENRVRALHRGYKGLKGSGSGSSPLSKIGSCGAMLAERQGSIDRYCCTCRVTGLAFPVGGSNTLRLTSENGDADYQIEAALPLVENLITVNAELVELGNISQCGRANELYSELEQRGSKMELSSSVGSNPMGVIPQSANVADTSAIVMDPTVGTAYSTDSTSEAEMESDEIVQIPLDENEVMDASDIEAGQND
ncbi:unnamed protein product [Fraxinus pennsylvanica]|uniref:Uncharacterized protein n=1 Tax=Fraxinus pennsylvanica TaxID=56036 RepID=A0AAD1ZS89_9LAMI|nr:unnamed protein product [Fraxinus pennsylvanica]